MRGILRVYTFLTFYTSQEVSILALTEEEARNKMIRVCRHTFRFSHIHEDKFRLIDSIFIPDIEYIHRDHGIYLAG